MQVRIFVDERDLGVLVGKLNLQCPAVAIRVVSLGALIVGRERDSSIWHLSGCTCKSSSGPHNPKKKKDLDRLYRVQRMATEMISGLENLPFL